MKNIKFEYQVPIQSKTNSDNDFIISGVAINATTTRNGHVFLAEELQKSAKTLRNKPLLKDHNNSVESIVGRVTNNVSFNTEKEQVLFDARVMDKVMQEKISQGLIDSVSVGAIVKEVEYDDKDETKEILRGIEFLELSLVAVPADEGATFATAIAESLKTSEAKIEIRQHNKEEEKMSENTNILQEENDSLKKELQDYKDNEAVTKAEEEKVKLKEDIKKEILNDLVKKESEENEEETETETEPVEESTEEVEEPTESEEVPEEESEPEKGEEKMKGKVNNETVETEIDDSFVFETSGNGATFFKEKIDNPKFARD